MTPTNDAPVTVEQCDRDRAADLVIADGGQHDRAKLIRSGSHDEAPTVQAFARHRLAALASAPAGDGVVVPVIPTKEMLEASAVEWTSLCSGYPPEPGHYKFMTALWKAMLAAAPAALAHPRSAVAPAGDGVKPSCTCHPDDRPSGSCERKYAASECKANWVLRTERKRADANWAEADRLRAILDQHGIDYHE